MSLKESVFWTLFLALCFGGGYLHGSLPQSYFNKKVIKLESPLRIVYSGLDIENPKVLDIIDNRISNRVLFIQMRELLDLRDTLKSSPPPDLFIIPLEWAETLTNEGHLKEYNYNFFELAPEFSVEKTYIPLFWDIVNTKLRRWVIAMRNTNTANARIQSFVFSLYSEPTYEKILTEIKLRGVLKRIEFQAWPQEKKPSYLRNIPLNSIELKNKHYQAF